MDIFKIPQNKAACLNAPKCSEYTGHASGLCEACRKKTCHLCGRKFTANRDRATLKRALCGGCATNKRGKDRRNG